ncbi:hypothetical protein PVMG_06066 [Plasmodium vivax Mauritania I]|uniref:Uncharacterized protein n=1 Tax=Plasmodium vivax Mauritania I TaxID=1035515 RepID=A0A0J9VR02_PLAVI|nr:hypothetical protein PVMG_06066 [Plasmodium vivax Mauritania I]
MHNLNANDKFIKEFFRLIRNDNAYYYGLTKNYCKYVNFWLNDEFMKKGYHITGPEFHVFQTFVKKLNENTGNQNKLCDNYINRLKPEEFKKIDLLHRLYNSYNEIKVSPVTDSIKKCNNLHLLAKNYSEFIDEYYDDNNFYKNLEYIKKLILNITDKDNSPCVDKIYFRTPKKVIEIQEAERRAREEETARKALEEEKARKALEEEKARKARVEALDNQKAEMEQRVQSLRGNTEQLQLLRNNPLYGTSMEKSLSLSTDDSRVLQTPEGTLRHQTEENILQREEGYAQNDASRTTGTFGGSTGFPGYITEVLGSVEPGPVLGVSGIQSFKIINISLYYSKKKLSSSYNYVLNSLNFLLNFSILHLDPSLEEEEDECIKFLELLEDFHQENSQIFMNMMVDLLDMLQ